MSTIVPREYIDNSQNTFALFYPYQNVEIMKGILISREWGISISTQLLRHE